MYRRLLLPLDGSDLSLHAIPHAAEVARLADAEVVLIQVVDSEAQIIAQTTPSTIEPLPSGPITADVAREAAEGQRRAAQQNLEEAAQRLRNAGVEKVQIEIAEGSPGEAITHAVERLGCDLVVMATRGRSGFRRAVLGSVADHVVRHTPGAAVLLVHPEQ